MIFTGTSDGSKYIKWLSIDIIIFNQIDLLILVLN